MAGIYTSAVALEEEIDLVTFVKSASAIIDTSEASFNTIINSFATGGIRRLIDCGKIMSLIVCAPVSPNALDASNCPLSMDWIAARMISEQYAALFNENAINAAKKRLFIVNAILICGNPKYMKYNCIKSGVPRKKNM